MCGVRNDRVAATDVEDDRCGLTQLFDVGSSFRIKENKDTTSAVSNELQAGFASKADWRTDPAEDRRGPDI